MRYLVLAWLSCQQYLAVSFLYAAVPAVLRQQGVSLAMLGLFGLVFFAFTVNFLWAPLLDRLPLTRLGRRRSWILAMQLAAAVITAAAAALAPGRHTQTLLVASLLLATVAATQRMATLAYAAEALPAARRSYGAAAMGWGMSAGNAIGGAAGLMLIERHGWSFTLLVFAVVMMASAMLVLCIAEPRAQPAPPASIAWVAARQWRAIVLIVPATFGSALAFPMAAPWLVDLGLPLSEVGLSIALVTVLAFSTAGPLAGHALHGREPLAAVRLAMLVLTPIFVLASLAQTVLSPAHWALFGVAVIFIGLAVQNVAFNTWFYSLARPGEAASDVSFLSAMMSLIAMAGFAASGFVASRWGYGATLAAGAAGYALTALLSLRYAR